MTATLTSPVAESLAMVRRNIEGAALAVGRDPAEVTLIAVTKGFPVDSIQAARSYGQLDFGENRVQELVAKHSEMGSAVNWHFVGRLQRNKVRQVLPTGAVIHSVDWTELAEEISRRAAGPVQVLLEVNASGEPQKGGVESGELGELVELVLSLPRVDPVGLMTMAPRSSDPEFSRPVFRVLARLRDEVAARYSDRIHHLSMGMSQDYRVAVEEGATMVRVGEAIFGPRRPEQSLKRPYLEEFGT